MAANDIENDIANDRPTERACRQTEPREWRQQVAHGVSRGIHVKPHPSAPAGAAERFIKFFHIQNLSPLPGLGMIIGSCSHGLRHGLPAIAPTGVNVIKMTPATSAQRNSYLSIAIKILLASFILTATAAQVIADDANLHTRQPMLQVFPAAIELSGKNDFQNVIAQQHLSNGITVDVSEKLKLKVKDPAIASVANGKVVPVAQGETVLVVDCDQCDGQPIEIPVTVTQADFDPPLSFQLDVMPVFARTGCNSGSCHGAAQGKDGFRLSLFGYDPEGDYFRLTREMLGRRIDIATPDNCLLTNKVTGRVAHSGGTLFSADSDYYKKLQRWMAEGALYDEGEVPEVTSVTLMPPSAILDGPEASQRLIVSATYSDGSTRDVTDLATFSTTNTSVASISKDGIVAGGQRGEAFVMARFGTHTVGSEFVTLPAGLEFTAQPMPENNYIDQRINEKLFKLRINPSELCSDEVFLRRASLDICGVAPTVDEIKSFVSDTNSAKRAQLIDRLLDREEFVSIWVMKWTELLQIRSYQNVVSPKAAILYHRWLKEKISANTPVDQIITELLGSTGSTFSNPPTNFYMMEIDPLKLSENVAQSFMGMRIQCAQCHNHPFDRWTMDDYYSFAAFFAQVKRKRTSDARQRVITSGGGETKHPVSGKVMQPKFLGGEQPDVKGKDRRLVLAEWMTAKENPYFARNLSNIVWAHFFGRGIIDEVDDVRVSNPPVNEPLLADLANHFSQSGYDFKKLVRDICNSRTYQLSTQANASNESDLTNFSHAYLRRMPAEIMLDVIAQVTQTKNKFNGLPLGGRAIDIADGQTTSYFLKTFGRSTRESVCSCETRMEPNLSQALHLINGNTIEKKIRSGNRIGKWQKEKLTDEQIIERLYYTVLNRKPETAEVEKITSLFDETDDAAAKKTMLEDVYWALLNSSEFLFNH